MTFPPLVLEGLSILGGIAFLVWGADRFVLGASALANNMGVSPLLIGLTIVGFGTSAPEMLVSAVAASQGSSGIAIGNAVGSNITNAALVLGASALVGPLAVHSKVIRRELPVLLLVSLGAYALMWDRHLGRGDGIALLLCLIGMVSWVVREARMEGSEVSPDALSVEMEDEIPRDMSTPVALFWVVFGLAILMASSDRLVWGATGVARHFNVPDLLIGLTVVAVGTSLPELAASVAASRRGEDDIAIGNVVGSNIFNLLGVLALPGIIAPGGFDEAVLRFDFPVMIGLTVLVLVLARGFRNERRLTRAHGALLVACFVAYNVYLFTQHAG
ncbi:MAG: calcium/sodium antiporter [Sandaracinaceae bacterium]|nr:calcium/sodium antiporter [Sandaracinaceae bacterium]MBK7151331.1 calcium/sodium antiporter [Sandaracinaceae bacterium]MBK7778048.1 calcium/sodium antiporter [Sandaracinaceae bacterium]MBK8588554.1 calcium/sodium antiporter [Sandaracinaceae bacterium]